MTDTLNILWGTAPFVLAAIAVIVAVEALAFARQAVGRMNELEALVSRYRRAEANAAARLRAPEVG